MLELEYMPFTGPLNGCWAKLGRAREHRTGLAVHIEQYFAIPSNRPKLMAELDSATGCHVFRVASVPPISELQDMVALMIGDAVHNLRSALDHLAFQLAWINTNGHLRHPKKVQFPIADTLDNYAEQERRFLGEVHHTYQTMIDSYQPYRGPGGRPDNYHGPYVHQLSLLRELSNCDKHQLLNTVLTIPAGAAYALPPGIELATFEPMSLDEMRRTSPFRHAGEKLEVGAEVFRQELLGRNVPITILDLGYVIPTIALEENRPAVETLERIEIFVDLVLNEFQAKLNGATP